MKIAELNMLPNGSTGKIMFQVADVARKKGHIVRTFSPAPFSRVKTPKVNVPDEHYIFGSFLENGFHYYAGTLLGKDGFFSKKGTKELLRELDDFQPDVIHLHNLHNFTINLPMLFHYIKQHNIRVIWTLHDCWTFTGHCPHFTMIQCNKWKTHCENCPQPRIYPKMYKDTSYQMFDKKKEMFSNIQNMILVTPSQWLADLTRESFLSSYPVKVIYNGIDLNTFQYIESDFREKHDIKENEFVLLGVAFGWGERKGLDVFIKLAKKLPANYRIVLVGTDDYTDQQLPSSIISIHRTNNQSELAEIYSAADLFVNPTREDTFPTTNLEALACGLPVITFQTGGSPESINEKCGVVVPYNDVDTLQKEIRHICEIEPFQSESFRKRAMQFDMNDKFLEYVDLFNTLEGNP